MTLLYRCIRSCILLGVLLALLACVSRISIWIEKPADVSHLIFVGGKKRGQDQAFNYISVRISKAIMSDTAPLRWDPVWEVRDTTNGSGLLWPKSKSVHYGVIPAGMVNVFGPVPLTVGKYAVTMDADQGWGSTHFIVDERGNITEVQNLRDL